MNVNCASLLIKYFIVETLFLVVGRSFLSCAPGISFNSESMVTCMCAAKKWALNHGHSLHGYKLPHPHNGHTISTKSEWVLWLRCACVGGSAVMCASRFWCFYKSRGRLRSVPMVNPLEVFLLKSMICFGYEFAKQCVRLIAYGQFMGNNYTAIHESLHPDLGMRTGWWEVKF